MQRFLEWQVSTVYKKHGRGKEDDYVSEQLEFSDGPYVNEEEDEEEE